MGIERVIVFMESVYANWVVSKMGEKIYFFSLIAEDFLFLQVQEKTIPKMEN